MNLERRYHVAIDIGGTFVDAVQFDASTGEVTLAKAPTTPARPADGVMEAMRRLGTPIECIDVFIHGTTLGLNAIIERRGAVTGVITNAGFRDVFEIARADVPPEEMYDVRYARAASLVRRRHRIGVRGRLDASGAEVTPLDEVAVAAAADTLAGDGVRAVAISFLHSYRNARHEQRAAAIVRERHPELAVSAGSELTREYREYERTATAVLDAYIRPIFEAYVDQLDGALRKAGFVGRFLIMRSSGGAMTALLATRTPIHTALSGPAGGIVGSAVIARATGLSHVLALDFGGTSLDASVIEDGEPRVMHEAMLEHMKVLMPIFDIRCIGAGGGSIASVEEGLLQVGPRSAGAVPGPIAYRKGGTEPTTTDAALVLGWLDPSRFLAGALPLDLTAACDGVRKRLAAPLSTDEWTAAAGVFEVLVAKTVGAIREITVERGKDPAEFVVLAFGGAGPMIAPLIAREIETASLVVPRFPGVFSAWGMLRSDLVSEFAQSAIGPLDESRAAALAAAFAELEREALNSLAEQGVVDTDRTLLRTVECRYAGQEHAIGVPFKPGTPLASMANSFSAMHRQRYGHALADPVQSVTLRVRATGLLTKPPMPRLAPAQEPVQVAAIGTRDAWCFARRQRVSFAVYARERLGGGHSFQGPAIVDEGTSTTVIHSDQSIEVDSFGQLVVATDRAWSAP